MTFARYTSGFAGAGLVVGFIGLTTWIQGGERPQQEPVAPKVHSQPPSSVAPAAAQPTNIPAVVVEDVKNPEARLAELTDEKLFELAKNAEAEREFAKELGISSAKLQSLMLSEIVARLEARGQADSKLPEPETQQMLNEAPAATSDTGASLETSNVEETTELTETVEGVREVKIESIDGEAYAADPMGVGRIKIEFARGQGPTIYPDQTLYLRTPDSRTAYPSFDIKYDGDADPNFHIVRKIEVHFLIRDAGPLELQVESLGIPLAQLQLDQQNDSRIKVKKLKTDWWDGFKRVTEQVEGEQKKLNIALIEILSRRHGLPSPVPGSEFEKSQNLASLEAQFERAIGMLLGIESVKLAMQTEVVPNENARLEKATIPLPNPPRLRSIDIPSYKDGWIEPLASHVPEECFYLRTTTASNYLYFRDFLLGWGGDLSNIVSSKTIDRPVRAVIEHQLAISTDLKTAERIDTAIDDMALIGCDPLFADGAAVGVIFQAGDGVELAKILKSMRVEVNSQNADVSEQRLSIGGSVVSLLSSANNKVRSFYAIDGPFHLVTNCQYLVERFFEAGDGDRALAGLREFEYARSKTRMQNHAFGFLYLSDPFFQTLISPHYRVEMARRTSSLRELQHAELAEQLAKAEGVSDQSVQQLIKDNFLPSGFGERFDGSFAVKRSKRYEDSVRGAPGAFLPIPDTVVRKITQSELNAYSHFMQKYSMEWGRVDPVTVVLSRLETDSQAENVRIDIAVTPYARQRYAKLNTHLSVPSSTVLALRDDSLLTVQAAVRTTLHDRPHLLMLGLQDEEVEFEIANGQVRLLGKGAAKSYAGKHAFIALSPPSTEVLTMLSSELLKKDGKPTKPKTVPAPAPVTPGPDLYTFLLPPRRPAVVRVINHVAWVINSLPKDSISALAYAGAIEQNDDHMVVMLNEKLRKEVIASVHQKPNKKPAKVRMVMKSLQGAKVEPYIQAYTFMQARRLSSDNARYLSNWSDWLRASEGDARSTVEDLLRGTLQCPLGGNLDMSRQASLEWSSSAWREQSVYQVNSVPDTWKFPFTEWLRQLELHFNMDASTINAEIELTLMPLTRVEGGMRTTKLKL